MIDPTLWARIRAEIDESALTTLKKYINPATGRLDTAETDISALDTRITTLEGASTDGVVVATVPIHTATYQVTSPAGSQGDFTNVLSVDLSTIPAAVGYTGDYTAYFEVAGHEIIGAAGRTLDLNLRNVTDANTDYAAARLTTTGTANQAHRGISAAFTVPSGTKTFTVHWVTSAAQTWDIYIAGVVFRTA